MAGRALFGLISLVLVWGGLLLMLLIFLGGAIDHRPISSYYFLEADTSNIPGAPALSRWTFWNLCSVSNDGYNRCPSVHPAFPLDPPSHRNFNTETNVPSQFIGTSKYFYLTRFMFAFELIALFFGACSALTGVLALCTRLGSYLSGFLAMIALFFQTLTTALMTSAYVMGRDAFNSNKQTAKLGKYAFGFEWAAFACFLLATIFFCLGGRGRKDSTKSHSTSSSRSPIFGGKRSKSTRSQGSFFNSDADRKEYA